MVTQCPACNTRFRVTDSQLARAGGRVRCGGCLEIFLAPDNRVGEQEDAKGTRSANTREALGQARSKSSEERPAGIRRGSGRWVRWALIAALLVLLLQVGLYLA